METPPLEDIAGFAETCMFLGLDKLDRRTSNLSETPRVVSIIVSLLETAIWKNEILSSKNDNKGDTVTMFHGSKAPELSVKQYMERIFKYTNCSTSCFVVAYMYIQKFVQKCSGVYLTSLNVHRILITSIMVAAKFLDDTCDNNAYYAIVGGVSTDEINRLEVEFLFGLDFRLQVTTEAFARFCQYLIQKHHTTNRQGYRMMDYQRSHSGQSAKVQIRSQYCNAM